MGGYLSFPVCISAFILRRPIVLYENNSLIGKTNKLLSFISKRILTSFPEVKGISQKNKNKVICNEEEKAWKIFGIPYNSSKREIKKRYNQLAKRFHPDHNKNNPKAEELLKEINIAYSIINNSLCKDNIQ